MEMREEATSRVPALSGALTLAAPARREAAERREMETDSTSFEA